MFDPERDDGPGRGAFYWRIGLIALIGVAAAIAVFPLISAFPGGPDQARTCVAVIDGWQADRAMPPASDLAKADAYIEWENGPGQCTRESRHRLIVSGVALGIIAALVAGGVARKRSHRPYRLAT